MMGKRKKKNLYMSLKRKLLSLRSGRDLST